MRTFLFILTSTFLLCACQNQRVAQHDPNAEPVVFVEKQSRMFRPVSKQSGQPVVPKILIYADGRCHAVTSDGDELTKALTPSKVRALLDFLEREGLFSISDELIDRHMRAVEPHRVVVVDSSYTRIAIRQAAKSVRISRYALDLEVESYPEVPELQTVKKCVERVYETAGTRL